MTLLSPTLVTVTNHPIRHNTCVQWAVSLVTADGHLNLARGIVFVHTCMEKCTLSIPKCTGDLQPKASNEHDKITNVTRNLPGTWQPKNILLHNSETNIKKLVFILDYPWVLNSSLQCIPDLLNSNTEKPDLV